jgi:hypothetical protein
VGWRRFLKYDVGAEVEVLLGQMRGGLVTVLEKNNYVHGSTAGIYHDKIKVGAIRVFIQQEIGVRFPSLDRWGPYFVSRLIG